MVIIGAVSINISLLPLGLEAPMLPHFIMESRLFFNRRIQIINLKINHNLMAFWIFHFSLRFLTVDKYGQPRDGRPDCRKILYTLGKNPQLGNNLAF